ncbi:terminase small subunit, partial [Escherichia coli]
MAFLLNKSDMASSIGISVQAFDKWGVPPVERRGREVFYDVKTVLEIDRERRQQNQKSSGGENDLEERLLQARVNLTEEQAIAQRLKNQVAEHKVIDTAFSIFALSRLSTTTGDWTTAQFIGWLESQGAFNHPYWMCKGSWSYGNNKIIT